MIAPSLSISPCLNQSSNAGFPPIQRGKRLAQRKSARLFVKHRDVGEGAADVGSKAYIHIPTRVRTLCFHPRSYCLRRASSRRLHQMYLIEIHLTITTERPRRSSLSTSRYQKGDHSHDRVKTASSDVGPLQPRRSSAFVSARGVKQSTR